MCNCNYNCLTNINYMKWLIILAFLIEKKNKNLKIVNFQCQLREKRSIFIKLIKINYRNMIILGMSY